MATVIDGKASAARFRDKIAAYAQELKSKHGLQPGLATVLVGKDPASEVYVRNKRKTAEAIGFKSVHVELPESVSQNQLLAQVKALSDDPRCMASWCSYRCPSIWTKMRCWTRWTRPRMSMR